MDGGEGLDPPPTLDMGEARARGKEYKVVGEPICTPEPWPPRTGESVSLGKALRKVAGCPLCAH